MSKITFVGAMAVVGVAACAAPLDEAEETGEARSAVEVAGARGHASIAARIVRACAVGRDGHVSCWGENTSGTFGNGTGSPTFSDTPVVVPGLSNQVAVALGVMACSLGADGHVSCWGYTALDADGNQIITQPALVSAASGPLTNIVSIAAADSNGCAVEAQGRLWCWGLANAYGQLGNGGTVASTIATQVPLTDVVSVSMDNGDACAVTRSGALYCWGSNDRGQLGDGTMGDSAVHATPQLVPLSGVASVQAAGTHPCAVLVDGTARCWGYHVTPSQGVWELTPTAVLNAQGTAPLANIRSLHGGDDTKCAILGSGDAFCWGYNDYGFLGIGSTTPQYSALPVQVAHVSTGSAQSWPLAELSSDGLTTCGRSADGSVWCWGLRNEDFGGPGNFQVLPTLVQSAPSIGGTPSVATSPFHTCVVRAQGGVVQCFGANGYGQLGNGSTTQSSSPVTVSGLTDVVSVTTSDSAYFTCALKANGTAWCWGANASGQLGNGSTVEAHVPVQVGVSNTVQIAAGGSHACALDASGYVRCWGDNVDGALGVGSTTSSSTPVYVSLGRRATAIAVGSTHSCALLDDGSMRCWGQNAYGQVGVGTSTVRYTTPQTVALGGAATAIGAGGWNTCAIVGTGGAAKCWGYNAQGQVGDGSTITRTSPTPVYGLSEVASLSVGMTSCAVLAPGGTKCWGYNAQGTVGDGTTTDRHTPTTTSGISNAVTIASSTYSSCAIEADGSLWCWGANYYGAIGNGTTNASTVPTQSLASP